jgi:hypothetical protein
VLEPTPTGVGAPMSASSIGVADGVAGSASDGTAAGVAGLGGAVPIASCIAATICTHMCVCDREVCVSVGKSQCVRERLSVRVPRTGKRVSLFVGVRGVRACTHIHACVRACQRVRAVRLRVTA